MINSRKFKRAIKLIIYDLLGIIDNKFELLVAKSLMIYCQMCAAEVHHLLRHSYYYVPMPHVLAFYKKLI